jgi:hypothetical protein
MALPIQNNKPVRILVLEGGAIYGVLSSKILQEIEQQANQPLNQLFDLMVGTSTGALQIAILNKPIQGTHKPQYSASNLVEFYTQLGPQTLHVSLMQNLKTLWGVFRPRISPKKLAVYMQQKLGDFKLKQSLTNVIIPTYDLNSASLLIFDSSDAKLGEYSFYDILLGAIAIPNIIEAHSLKINNQTHYLNDAMLIENNPVILALSKASMIFPNRPVIIVSIGVGKLPPPDHPKKLGNQGTAWVVNNWMGMIFKGRDHSTTHLFHSLQALESFNILGFYKIDPMVSKQRGGPIDVSRKNISILNTAADSYIKTHQRYFSEMVTVLKQADMDKGKQAHDH